MPKAFLHLATIVLFFGASAYADSLEALGDSGIKGPKYQVILDDLAKLAKDNPKYAEVYDYGKSVGGRTLRMLVIAKKDSLVKRRKGVQITGSIHGNEYLNIADRLPGEFLKRFQEQRGSIFKFINAGGVVLFVPIVNPDGYERRRRHNNNNKDLNRDWDVDASGKKGFKEVETKTLRDALEFQKKKLDLVMKVTVDYHCCAGALLYPWAFTKKPMPKADLDEHLEYAEASKGLDIRYGTAWDILGYLANGTTMDYYYESQGTNAYTFEGRYREENKYFSQHVVWWEKALEALN